MKIMILNAFERTAATTIRMDALAAELARNHKVTSVSYSDKASRRRQGNLSMVDYKKVFPGPLTHFYHMFLKNFVCFKENCDLIIVSKPLPWALFPGQAARFFFGKKLIVDWDEHEQAIMSRVTKFKPYLWLMSSIEKQGIKMADGVVVVSPYLRDLALKWGVKKHRIAVVQNGVDMSKFKSTKKPADLKKKFKLKGKIVMFLGSLRPQFDLDLVFNAMKQVKKEVKDAQLVIVGGGAHEKNLKKQAKEIGVADYVHFLGFQPYEDVPSFIKMADVVVAPNRDNDMNRSRSPVKIAEYMALGAPIVANSVGLVESMLADGAGELVKSSSAKEMAEKIVLLLKNKKHANSVSKKAKQRARSYYSWKKLGSKLNKFVENYQ